MSIKVFFIEPSGLVQLRVKRVGVDDPLVFDQLTQEQAELRSSAMWKDGGIEYSSKIPIYRSPAGSLFTINDAPPGAMWDADWQRCFGRTGPDGIDLMVKCPDGHTWNVDGRASNCTRPDDNAHRCWCRHGDVRRGEIHVDKIGDTCAAGAGSILTPQWHGFLHDSCLVQC